MNEFIEKLVTRLEKDNRIGRKSFEAIVENINELAEEYKPKTNADQIRSMSDEELAELFAKLAWNSEVQTTPLKYLDWLQSEAE